jgi:hypothetical protein
VGVDRAGARTFSATPIPRSVSSGRLERPVCPVARGFERETTRANRRSARRALLCATNARPASSRALVR